MKKLLFLFFILLSSHAGMHSQSGKELLTLDNYLIPKNKKGISIGKFNIPAGEKISLTKDNSRLFTISKDGYISLKKMPL